MTLATNDKGQMFWSGIRATAAQLTRRYYGSG
jgi:hypothetical protein